MKFKSTLLSASILCAFAATSFVASAQTLRVANQGDSLSMLLDAIPKMHDTGRARTPVSGEVPNPLNPPHGCTFHPRCPHGGRIEVASVVGQGTRFTVTI